MFGDYLGILVLIVVAAIVATVMIGGSWLFGPKKHTPYKSAAYECGVTPVGDAKERFPIKFYLVAIIFILFDIEVVFLWSWMTVYRTGSLAFKQFTFLEFLTYMATWVVGYVYVIKVGAIDWDETLSLTDSEVSSHPGQTSVHPGARPVIEAA